MIEKVEFMTNSTFFIWGICNTLNLLKAYQKTKVNFTSLYYAIKENRKIRRK